MKVRELTDSEVEIVEALSDVWRAFLLLPTSHGDDVRDFKFAICAAQRIVLVHQPQSTSPDGLARRLALGHSRVCRSHLCAPR